MAWIAALLCAVLLQAASAEDYATNQAVQLLQQYVQINTTTGGDLSPAVEFWRTQAAAAKLEFKQYNYTAGYPVLVLRWPGQNCSLGSIMLNSHLDVVPADESEGWTYPPFSGYLDSAGVIWGRGTQDIKGVSIQYLEAIKQLIADGVRPLRDVYMTLMPDEEVGAENGMRPFLESDEFKDMNVGVELDEGTSYNLSVIPVFIQDKVPWQIQVDCYAPSAHSSTFPETNDTATGKCYNVIKKMFEFRDSEYEIYKQTGVFNAGAYTSVNLNKINGGTANNVIPSHMSLVFDIRLSTSLNEATFEQQLNEWISSAGDNVTLTYILKDSQSPATVISASNPYWTKFQNLGISVVPLVPPGSTDARFVREKGIPAFGFSPMPNTELLLHAVNERLSAQTLLNGIGIYKKLISALANIPEDQTSADPSVYVVKTAV